MFVQSTTSFDFYYLNSTLCESLDCKLKTQLRNNATQTVSTGVRNVHIIKIGAISRLISSDFTVMPLDKYRTLHSFGFIWIYESKYQSNFVRNLNSILEFDHKLTFFSSKRWATPQHYRMMQYFLNNQQMSQTSKFFRISKFQWIIPLIMDIVYPRNLIHRMFNLVIKTEPFSLLLCLI